MLRWLSLAATIAVVLLLMFAARGRGVAARRGTGLLSTTIGQRSV